MNHGANIICSSVHMAYFAKQGLGLGENSKREMVLSPDNIIFGDGLNNTTQLYANEG